MNKNSRRLVAAFIGVALLSAAIGFGGTFLVKSPAEVAKEAAPPNKTTLTARVRAGSVHNTLLLAGSIAVGGSADISPTAPIDGSDQIVTGVNVPVGQRIRPGEVVLTIADRPLIVLPGNIPLIRDLQQGMTGPDVARFQEALRAVGEKISDPSGTFGWSTAAAVRALYKARGFTAPTTSGTPSGPVIVSRSEIALVGGGATGIVAASGAVVGTKLVQPALTVSTSAPQVTADVAPADAAKLKVGMDVSISGTSVGTVEGHVTEIGQPVQTDSNGFQSPLTVTASTPLNQTAVGGEASLTFDLSEKSEVGLVVPLAALNSSANGHTYVTELRSHGKREIIFVKVLQSGDGEAELPTSTTGLKANDDVVVGSTK